jgi:hypothetical protein
MLLQVAAEKQVRMTSRPNTPSNSRAGYHFL